MKSKPQIHKLLFPVFHTNPLSSIRQVDKFHLSSEMFKKMFHSEDCFLNHNALTLFSSVDAEMDLVDKDEWV